MDGEARPFMGTVDLGADEFTDTHTLAADGFLLTASEGGLINFTLQAGGSNGNRPYLMLGSTSGTGPGTPLPESQAVLPLNMDFFLFFVLYNLNSAYFINFAGNLGHTGFGVALYNTQGPLPSVFKGLTVSFAYLLYDPTDFASNPINVVVE
jgi:hypothetical protein